MFADHEKVARVGIWVVVVAAVAGLCVLFLAGDVVASPATRDVVTDANEDPARLLLVPVPETAEDRLAAAEQELSDARSARGQRLMGELLDTGWKVWASSDPRRVARSALGVGRELWSWGRRDAAEDRALTLLEVELDSEHAPAELRELHSALSERAIAERVRDLLAEAEQAIDDDHALLARVKLARAIELAPDSPQAEALTLRLNAGTVAPAHRPLGSPAAVNSADADLATALLLGDYDRAVELAPQGPEGDLARSAARYLNGEATLAAVGLEPLAERNDALGATARSWSVRPGLSAPGRFKTERRRYRIRRALGLIGGDALAADGLDVSRRGLNAWKRSLSPLNLALSVPARFVRGWTPDDSELRAAALSCIEHHAGTGLCSRAEDWISDPIAVQPSARAEADVRGWSDGHLVLPDARTAFVPLAPVPLVLTRDALQSEFLPALGILRDTLDDAPALILRPEFDAVPAPTLTREDALLLLADATLAIESNGLAPLTSRRTTLLEGLRRLDRAVRNGARLVVTPVRVGKGTLRDAATVALLDGGKTHGASVGLTRTGDDLTAVHDFASADFTCPRGAVCIDRRPWWRAGVYGSVDTDAEMRLGARADLHSARIAVEISESGPNATLVVPVARWLGVDRWVPVAAQVAVGTDGIYFGPVLLD